MSNQLRGWQQIHSDLGETFRKWGVEQWETTCKLWGQKATNWTSDVNERAVFVRFTHPDGQTIQLRMDAEARAVDNYRQLQLGIDEMRNIYRRGLENMVRTAYLQLAAPDIMRDPYEVLGVRPDTALEDIESMYLIKAKRAHPDFEGGSNELMQELNAAIERIRGDKAVQT